MSDVINVTFVFLRDEFRGIAHSLLVIIAPLVVVASILTAGQMAAFEGMFNPEWWLEEEQMVFGPGYVIGLVLTTIAYVMLYLVFFAYAMLYAEQGPGPFTPGEVWGRMRAYAGRYFSSVAWIVLLIAPLTLLNLILCLGTLAFLAVVAWLLPIWGLVFPARFDRGDSFWQAFRRCRELVRGEWWAAFGLFFVMQVLVMVVSMALSMVVMAGYGFAAALFGSGVIAQVSAVLLSLASVVGYTAYVLPAVAFVIHYFNLVEQLEGVGLESEIESIAADRDESPPLAY